MADFINTWLNSLLLDKINIGSGTDTYPIEKYCKLNIERYQLLLDLLPSTDMLLLWSCWTNFHRLGTQWEAFSTRIEDTVLSCYFTIIACISSARSYSDFQHICRPIERLSLRWFMTVRKGGPIDSQSIDILQLRVHSDISSALA